MYTLGDKVLDDVKRNPCSTRQALELLELPDEDRFNSAGNIYLAALSIIEKLQNKIKELEEGK